jgi:hypothetical protein
MKTKKNKDNKSKTFNKYDKNKKGYLTKKQIILLFNKEFKLYYDSIIINSLMNIWGTKINSKLVITKETFKKLFQKPYGFLKDFRL